jgi:ATP-dependent Clp protease ATP-binding subunit ClpC
MRLLLPVLVHHDTFERYHVALPRPWAGKAFQSRSLSEALDDAALHVMEFFPGQTPDAVAQLIHAPNLAHRTVRVEAQLKAGPRKRVAWKGRLSVWVERWRGESFHVATLPRLKASFPVVGLSDLPEAVGAFLSETYTAEQVATLDAAVCQPDEHLEILEVETEAPTILPSRRPRRRKRKKKKGEEAAKKDKAKKKKKVFVPPTTLREVGRNLANAAIDGRLLPAFGRDAVVQTVLTELERPGAAVLLVGASGVGKSAIVHEVVRRIVDPEAPLQERTDVWEVDGNRIIAGQSVVGQWERRVERLVEELTARDDILYVDDLPTLVYTGRSAQSDMNVAAFLEPHLAHGELRMLGETTPERLAACRDEAPGFFNRFRLVHVDALPPRETLMVLLRALRDLEARRAVSMRPESLRSVQGLARRFHAREHEPGASVRLLSSLTDLLEPAREDEDEGRGIVDRDEILDAYQRMTGLPRFLLVADGARERRPETLRAWFQHRILGQPNAVDAASEVVLTLQQAMDDPKRPVATLLLVGPTGVGKTETAKALATWLFGSPDRLIRIDMSEIRDTRALGRLVGDAANPDGELTRRVTSEPFSVVLFDEVEKAHSAVFDLLLQVTGEGRLTNAAGQTADFTNTVVLLTSNLGVSEAGRKVGFADTATGARDLHYTKAAEAFFKPEFFNRIDRVVPYRALQRTHVAQLAARLLAKLTERRGLRASSVLVRVAPEVVTLLVEEGFDPVYGARALKRTLENRLTVPLARLLATSPVAHMAFLDVFSVAGDVEITLAELEAAPTPDLEFGVPEDWDGLRATHAEIRARLLQLETTSAWQEARDARSRLIQSVQADYAEADEDALSALTDLLSRARDIHDQLDEIEEEAFVTFTFEDTYEREVEIHQWDIKTHLHKAWEVSAVDHTRLLTTTRHQLVQLRQAEVQLGWLAANVHTPIVPFVVRVLPETEGDGSRRTVTAAMSWLTSLWGPWGRTEELYRHQGTWHPSGALTRLAETRRQVLDEVDGAAVHVFAPGGRAIAEALCGYAVDHRILGPDNVASLVRIELLEGDATDALALLEADDARWEAWRAERSRGEATRPSPRPPLPSLLRTGDGTGLPTSGGADALRVLALQRVLEVSA